MEEKKLIEKRKDATDKRCNRIYLTAKGHSSKDIIEESLSQWNELLTKDMLVDQTDEVLNVLSQMVNNIENLT